MRAVIVAALVAFLISLFGTPHRDRCFRRLKAGQPIRADGPQPTWARRARPRWAAWCSSSATVHRVHRRAPRADHAADRRPPGVRPRPAGAARPVRRSAALVGFLDDFLKVRKQQPRPEQRGKLLGQLVDRRRRSASLALQLPQHRHGRHGRPSTHLSFIRDIACSTSARSARSSLFVFVVIAMSNGVNLTDGLDGLATGASVDGARRVRADRVLAVPALVRRPDYAGPTTATRCATRWRSR